MTDLSRIHYWHYVIAENGVPIQDAEVRFYLNGTTTEANIFLSETSTTPTTTSNADIKTDADGFFEFWLENGWETGGYPHTQQFKLEWFKAGARPTSVENINPWPNTFKWEDTRIGEDKNHQNKFISDYYGNKWWSHLESLVPSASSHNLHAVDLTNICTDDTYNKVLSNKFGYDILDIASTHGSATVASQDVIEDRYTVTSWTSSGGFYYKDLTHSNVYCKYVSVQVKRSSDLQRIEPKDVVHINTSTTRVWMDFEVDVDISIHGETGSSSSSSTSSSSSVSSSSSSSSKTIYTLFSADSATDKIYKHDGFSSTIADSFSSPSISPSDLAWDGTNIMSFDTSTTKAYRHSGFTSTIDASFNQAVIGTTGLTWTGSSAITVSTSSDDIYVHSGFSTTVIDSFNAPGPSVSYLGWDGTNIISGERNNDIIYQHSGTSETISDSFSSPSFNLAGVSWAGSHLYSADNGTEKIYKHSGFTSTITNSFIASGGGLAGITMET
jgi:hypothetical protein